MQKLKARKPPKKRRVYKSSERRERLRIYTLYNGPSTDTQAAIRAMDQIHKWIKEGAIPPRDELKLRQVNTPAK